MFSFKEDVALSIEALKAADNETLTGAGVDMLGYQCVAFLVGALKGEALSFSVKAQQDTDPTFASAADLQGTATAFATTTTADGLAVLDIHNPQERYVRAVVTVPNATNATPTFCLAVRYNPVNLPQSNAGELHNAPQEGEA